MKQFFNITEPFRFEYMDFSAVMTILNVTLVLMGFWFAPIFGIANAGIAILFNIKNQAHINSYMMNIALIILNIYFLNLA